jgi:hypothetical protein
MSTNPQANDSFMQGLPTKPECADITHKAASREECFKAEPGAEPGEAGKLSPSPLLWETPCGLGEIGEKHGIGLADAFIFFSTSTLR